MRQSRLSAEMGVDPYYLYLALRDDLGPGRVFLLEAGREDIQSDYQMSLIGMAPLVEVQVRDHVVSVFAHPKLAAHVFSIARSAGVEVSRAPYPWESVVGGDVVHVQAQDPMALLDRIRAALCELLCGPDGESFSAGFLGYVAYDAIRYLERVPMTAEDDRHLPEIRLLWHAAVAQLSGSTVTVFRQDDAPVLRADAKLAQELDEMERRIAAVCREGLAISPVLDEMAEMGVDAPVITYDVPKDVYCRNVEIAIEYIRAGDIFQVVPSTRMQVRGGLPPLAAYDRLRRLNPSPYMFVAEYPGMVLYGASPEVQFRALRGRAEMKPIAGTTRGRGQSPEEDARLVAELKRDVKENAEHVMLVDLCRNDLGRVAKPGTVAVPELMVVERYSHLYHLVSRVTAELRDDVSVFHALLTTFPNGTLSGAPKIRAMEIIDELEPYRRGPYGGFIGMVDAWANANTAIFIRSVVAIGDVQYVQVGAGVVYDSVPEREWDECHFKAGAILDVLTGSRAKPIPVK
ncbi:anthranilate synthase component I family protein [Alicyclobacillus acidocaldarius]|uniref:anthranilate synthase n=1 Tax=Alicyclobacillus acidocaldarius subsp. acidocaldarius (strain ATCC 27009 / DSM 446 / BCRC 14685 / JCM 5260 / KCTC 1825 / NBRC 15652 / NCIMB 11725 / NRRL B-14509 / 104-IA) TaxID=521098 RepID=C8WVX7_ALIAD|nr:anthranilate synthase component I family protein [Alicyclobacillus acidocaldarius]ACV58249.1 Anthranilate synthase [Alicyclobacillus acidocaldarius subsp. acidocaldarius DSM 446]